MNKARVKTLDELAAELAAVAGPATVETFRAAVADGNKVEAIKIARAAGIAVFDPARRAGD